jgi:CNT family concentrative nucleoside transporter
MALLFHYGIIQRVVLVVSHIFRPLLGTSGAETLCAIANSFLGQTEAPLLVRHYLKHMTKSEMLVVMVSGMATISGAILAVFAAMGVPAQHLLASSVMAIPGSILIAKILYPETEKEVTAATAEITFDKIEGNVFSAIAQGTSDGLSLALNVGAMLISFLSLLALINAILMGTIGIDLNWIFARLFSPFAYLLGFTGQEAFNVGTLLGTKVTVNELVAYGDMVKMNLAPRTQAIVTYALCGFSNFSCIGIQVGGIGALVPEKRSWLCELGLYAVLGGSLSNLLSAMIASLLL